MSDRSIALALRIQKDTEELSEQIDRAFATCSAGHPPQPNENGCVCTSQKWSITTATQPQPVEYPTEITRSLVEEFSGKPFEYTEILPVFKDYVPDAKPWTVDVQTRALADMCLLLFNANEFAYVY